MKKLTSILLATVTAVVMGGCDGNDNNSGESVALADLNLGYKVTGTGGLAGYLEIISIKFCPIGTYYRPDESWDGDNMLEYVEQTNFGHFRIEGNRFFQDDYYAWVDTDAAGTPGRLEVGATYVSDEEGDPNSWTITKIEKDECLPVDR